MSIEANYQAPGRERLPRKRFLKRIFGRDANSLIEELTQEEVKVAEERFIELFDPELVEWGRAHAENYRNRIKSAIFSLTLKEILKDLSPKNYLVTTHLLELLKTPHEDLSF